MNKVSSSDEALERVWAILNREESIDSLPFLQKSLPPKRTIENGEDGNPISARNIAFGFDTNAVFRLGLGTRGDDALDYFRTQHDAPLIVPGQAVQELWNNQLSAMVPMPRKLQTMFTDLQKEAGKFDREFGDIGRDLGDVIDRLMSEHGETFDDSAQESLDRTLSMLAERATTSYVPRVRFASLAEIRNDTKTPPGFKDLGHGDFFVWSDFLFGLASRNLDSIKAVVLVSNDVKADWSRNGFPHPILSAEAQKIVSVPFELWTIDYLHKYISENS